MEAARGSWADVEDNVYIKDLNGKVWRVARSTPTRVRLIDRDEKTVDLLRPPGTRAVTFMVPTEEEARYTLAKALGARILASRDADGNYRAPKPETWDLESARWHMSRFHRIDTGDLSLDEIRELHETSEPTCPHEHTEDT
jgi:hypothetical protein